MPKTLIVQFTPIRSCLVHLPGKWVNALLDQKKLPQNVILEISPVDQKTTKKVYCGWSGESSKPLPPNSVFTLGPNGKLDVLEMDPQLGTAIGLQEGQKVNVDFCRNVPECSTVHVEPLTEDDWEILELHAGYVEDNLLSQVRTVYNNQIMCVWIHGKTLVKLVVGGIEPKHEYAKLTNQSEVIVAPKVRKTTQSSPSEESALTSSTPKKMQPSVTVRAAPCDESVGDLCVHVHPDCITSLRNENGQAPQRVRLAKLIPFFLTSSSSRREEEQQQETEEIPIAKALFATLVLSTQVPLRHVMIGSVLKKSLEIKDFDMIKISTIGIKKSSAGSLVLRRFVAPTGPVSTIKLGLESSQQQVQQKLQFEADCTTATKEWLSAQKGEYVISQGMVIDLKVKDKMEQFLIQLATGQSLFSSSTLLQDEEQFVVLSPNQKISIEFGEDISKAPSVDSKKDKSESIKVGGVDKLLNRIEQYTLANLAEKELKASLGVPGSGGILLTGAHGSGKTSIVHQVMRSVRKSLIYTLPVNCSELSDERIPVIKETLQKWLDEAAWHSPSLIFFDNLDRLIPAELEHADSTRSRHIAELFVRMVSRACQRHAIMVIATSQQQQSIHPALITHHVLSELCHLQPPNREERKLIMESIMSQGSDVLKKSLPSIDLVSVASETEGFLAADIKAFIERTVHEGAVRSIKKKMDALKQGVAVDNADLVLTQADFSKARQGFVPSSLRGVKLQSSGVNWSDIGGLNETRKALLETLEWPTKYAAVFSQCPLRLRSGLLLYGYPGCGKTLLASAVAKECGLNFISVKGPEILNKYIGASEKSVRDLFERAQAAKPCVLFFDEFDSIAPRRGHDSTGVTDRVVNQMLTQMDGAEGLDGVYVLAATSRPDLIDPALLRPGRLDKALLCGMPSVEERLEILQALSSKMKLAANVDLRVYAERTEGFSGADLQGFLYNAHLEAIHGSIQIETFKESNDNKRQEKQNEFVMNDNNKVGLTLAEKGQISQRLAMIKKEIQNVKKETPVKSEVVQPQHEAEITIDYLESSLRSTRPSITIEEYYRLKAIYDEFVTGRTGELPSGEAAKGIGKRSTLG
ncbi:Peroxisome biosynthesis protein pex1 [Rhizopus azygosporus]|uniref:Peroxisomal ATPase PEX1 n=1 Tax=Rhizopus azygosporus TaxID=86630 RepID=A0A367JFU9_RHIAZ|nr:Peroxisome biosynthesis protein pex1 [Rhizopus azygosporus]